MTWQRQHAQAVQPSGSPGAGRADPGRDRPHDRCLDGQQHSREEGTGRGQSQAHDQNPRERQLSRESSTGAPKIRSGLFGIAVRRPSHRNFGQVSEAGVPPIVVDMRGSGGDCQCRCGIKTLGPRGSGQPAADGFTPESGSDLDIRELASCWYWPALLPTLARATSKLRRCERSHSCGARPQTAKGCSAGPRSSKSVGADLGSQALHPPGPLQAVGPVGRHPGAKPEGGPATGEAADASSQAKAPEYGIDPRVLAHLGKGSLGMQGCGRGDHAPGAEATWAGPPFRIALSDARTCI